MSKGKKTNTNRFKIGNKELVEVILFLCGIVVTHFLDKNIVTTVLLVIALVCFHLFRTLKLLLRFLFLLIAIVSFIYAVYRIYPVLITQETLKQTTQLKDTLPIKHDTLILSKSFRNKQESRIVPYVGIRNVSYIFKDTISALIEFLIRGNIPATHFVHLASFHADTVTDADSVELVQIIKRRKNMGMTHFPNDRFAAVYSFGKASDFVSFIKKHIILGVISYYDLSGNYHFMMYCIICDPNSSIYHPYHKYNPSPY